MLNDDAFVAGALHVQHMSRELAVYTCAKHLWTIYHYGSLRCVFVHVIPKKLCLCISRTLA